MGWFSKDERDKRAWEENINSAEDRATRLTKQAKYADAAGKSKLADQMRRNAQEDIQMAQRMRGCKHNPNR